MSMVCSTARCKEEYDMIVSTSTNCSALRGRRRGQRCGTRSRETLGTTITVRPAPVRRSPARGPPPQPPPTTQERPGPAPWGRIRRAAPRCAAEPHPEAPAARPDRPAGNRRTLPRTAGRAPAGEEGASVVVTRRAPRAPLPGPGKPLTP